MRTDFRTRRRRQVSVQPHVTYERDDTTREEVGALLERLAHHVRAGIIVGQGEATPLPDELSVKVVVGPVGDGAMLRVMIGPRAAPRAYAHTRVEQELAHPGG